MNEQYPVPALDTLPAELCWKGRVAYLAYRMRLHSGDPEAQSPVGHIFTGGNYLREVMYPAGSLIIGRPHVRGHLCKLLTGTVVICEESERRLLYAPAEMRTEPGYQMVAQAVTAIVAVTVHPMEPGERRDIDALEEKWFAPEEPTLQLGEAAHLKLARRDYRAILEAAGEAGRALEERARTTEDVIAFPVEPACEVRASRIHGQGVFSTAAFAPGAPIAPLRVSGHRTPAGRYTNHCHDPNAKALRQGDDLYLYSLRHVRDGEEITVDYRQVAAANPEALQ